MTTACRCLRIRPPVSTFVGRGVNQGVPDGGSPGPDSLSWMPDRQRDRRRVDSEERYRRRQSTQSPSRPMTASASELEDLTTRGRWRSPMHRDGTGAGRPLRERRLPTPPRTPRGRWSRVPQLPGPAQDRPGRRGGCRRRRHGDDRCHRHVAYRATTRMTSGLLRRVDRGAPGRPTGGLPERPTRPGPARPR